MPRTAAGPGEWLYRSGNFGSQLNGQGLHHRQSRFECWVAVGAERAIKLLAGQPRLPCNLRHCLGARHHAQRVCDLACVIGLERFSHKNSHRFIRRQVFGRVMASQFFSHFHHSIPAPGVLLF